MEQEYVLKQAVGPAFLKSEAEGQMWPKVSILIPVKNAGPLLDRVMSQIFRQEAPFDFEVIAVDSGSSDETLEILSRYRVDVHEIPPEHFNHGGTRNYMTKLARGDYFVFITQDAVPADENWLANLVQPLIEGKFAGSYARQIPRVDTDPLNCFFLGEIYPDRSRVQQLEDSGVCLEVVRFSNASSAISRAVFEAIPFRSDIIMGEDQDWSVRALMDGHKIQYVSDARMEHAHHYTLRQTFKKYFDSGVSFSEIYCMAGRKRGFSSEFFRGGLSHVRRKLGYLYRTGNLVLLPRAIALSAVKAVAVIMGRHHRLLPMAVKMRCSWHNYHWASPPSPVRDAALAA